MACCQTKKVYAMISRYIPGVLKPGVSLLAAGFVLSACGGVNPDAPGGEFEPPVVEWRLVFEDNFDGDALDASKWNLDLGDGCPDLCGWGNNELQLYGEDNITVADGFLRIEGREELDGSYTSGRINTEGKFDFRYGRVEVSARIPSGQGTWPAIWLLHSAAGALNPDYPEVGVYGPWPMSGEIDIMEAFNYGVDGNQTTSSTAHYGLPVPPFDGTSSTSELAANADMSFHEYALEWERGRLRFFIDGVHFQTQIVDEYWTYYPANEDGFYDPFGAYSLGLEDAPFDQAFHLLINFAIGGNPVGAPDGSTMFPQAMEIDYVRVYECANSNPESGRGCGTADASVVPLEDNAGGQLEGQVTAKPYIEMVDLYLDGPETITVTIGDESSSNTLTVDGFTLDGTFAESDPAFPDPDDAENTVWHFNVSGVVANTYLASQDLTEDPLLDTGFDFSGGGLGGDPVGEVAFDMRVNSFTSGTELWIKLDSGFPNLGQVQIPESELLVGEWKTYSVKFDDLVANPNPEGTGVDLSNVANPFVIEIVNGDADVFVDNIRATNACYVVGACGAGPRTKGIPDLIVFDDAVNTATWDIGIAASDSGSGFVDYTDGTNPANKANWSIIDDADPERGQVIDVTFNDSSAFGVWFIKSTGAVNATAFAAGAVQFDLIVDDYANDTGMTMKIDCFFPCSSGDKQLGRVADGVWETITVPVASLTATGLDLENVNVGLVLFPSTQNETGTVRFRIDNIRWVADSDAIPLEQIDLPVTFDDPLTDYSVIDFGDPVSAATNVQTDDPTGAQNTVAATTKPAGAPVWAGTTIGTTAGFANPIPFAPGDSSMSVRVYSPAANVPVLLKVENEDASIFAEVMVNTTMADAWETLVFDFSTVGIDTSAEFIRAIIFFDFGTEGNDATYYWDDVAFGTGPTLAQVDLPVTFDDSGVDYDLGDFGNGATTLVADPLNSANMVASTNKPPGAELWAGVTVGATNGLAMPIPFTAEDTQMTVEVYSPDAGIPVLLKVEDKNNPAISVETQVLTTIADGWETLTFDFSNESAGTPVLDPSQTYDKVSIFFNFGTDGNTAGDKTYLWDDVEFFPSAATEPFVVFDDAVDPAWDLGLTGVESASNFGTLLDGTNGVAANWQIGAADDPFRGDVIEATVGGVPGEFGLMFFLASSPPGVDLGRYSGGSVVFDINVLDYGTNTNGMIMKVDCTDPCSSGEFALGQVGDGRWESVSIPVSQLVTGGLDLSQVNTGLVIFPDAGDQQAGATVVFQLDNVRWEPSVVPNLVVYDDAVDAAWDLGLTGVESTSNYGVLLDGTNGTVANWVEVAAADPARGQVIEATVGGVAGELGLMFFLASENKDLTAYDDGSVVFDINVLDYGTNTQGMVIKVDCTDPCSSGEIPLGQVGDGVWETVSITAAQLIAGGLDISNVNTGLVIFPNVADQQAGATVVFQLDSVRWEP
jgi:beta-glucanase (GH16 family)